MADVLQTTTSTAARVRAKKTCPAGVRYYTDADHDEVVEIYGRSGWGQEAIRHHHDLRLVATVDAHAGFEFIPLDGCLGCDECDGTPHARRGARVHISCLAVHPGSRRLGLAKNLLHAAKLVARRRGLPWLTLDVRQDNTAAIKLYKSVGFRPHYDLGVSVPPGALRLRRRA